MDRVNESGLTPFELLRQGYASSQVGNKKAVNVAGVGTTNFVGTEICRVEVGEDVACSWVVTLAPLSPVLQQGALNEDQGTPQIINDAFAIVEWGVGKGRSYVVVDWTLGQQFTVFGSYVSVRGAVNSLGAAAVGPAAVTSMSAFVAPGRTSRFPSRTVIYGDLGSGGGNTTLAVPPFARRLFLSFFTLGDPATVNAGVIVFGRLTTAAGTNIWSAAPGIESADGGPIRTVGVVNSVPVEIPMGTNFANVLNFSGSDLSGVRLRYDLVL